MSTRWAERYVGVPFLDGGRTLDGCDCWGLVRIVLAERAGIEVPSYDAISALDLIRVARQVGRSLDVAPWRTRVAVGDERVLDVAVLRVHRSVERGSGTDPRMPAHVGVIVGPGLVLHAQDGVNSVVQPIADQAIWRRIIGIFRHDALAGGCEA